MNLKDSLAKARVLSNIYWRQRIAQRKSMGLPVAVPGGDTKMSPQHCGGAIVEFEILWNQDGRHSSGYMELLPGEYKGKRWNCESAFIRADEFEDSLESIFTKHAPDFDHYGDTAIGMDRCWAIIDDLKALACPAASDLAIWLHGTVAKYGSITVLGM